MLHFKTKRSLFLVGGSRLGNGRGGYAQEADAPVVTKLDVSAEHANALYHQGEEVTFIIQSEGNVTPTLPVQWKLTKDNYTTIAEGVAEFQNGQAKVSGKLDEPGFCSVESLMGATSLLRQPVLIPCSSSRACRFPTTSMRSGTSRSSAWRQCRSMPGLPLWPNRSTEQVEVLDLKADAVGEMPVSGLLCASARCQAEKFACHPDSAWSGCEQCRSEHNRKWLGATGNAGARY